MEIDVVKAGIAAIKVSIEALEKKIEGIKKKIEGRGPLLMNENRTASLVFRATRQVFRRRRLVFRRFFPVFRRRLPVFKTRGIFFTRNSPNVKHLFVYILKTNYECDLNCLTDFRQDSLMSLSVLALCQAAFLQPRLISCRLNTWRKLPS